MTISAQTPVGDIATAYPLTTRVFDRYHIDFCCGGDVALGEACAERGAQIENVLAELHAELGSAESDQTDWTSEPLNSLIDHILHQYHAPLREDLPRLEELAQKVHGVHGDKNPERFAAIVSTFGALKAELEQHMLKEEEILFPMIRAGQGSMADGPIAVMELEHREAGAALERLRELTGNYEVPDEACNSWRALWDGLADLERALHEHIHLENNILHRRVLAGSALR